MEDWMTFDTVAKYSAFNNNPTLHPLVNVLDLSKATPRQHFRMHIGLYMIHLKEIKCGNLRYGCNYYDYEEGSLVFFAPGQVAGVDSGEIYQPKGKALVFHPDFIKGTSLGRHMQEYSFFSYEVNESLHMSELEKKTILGCFEKIGAELEHAIDKHTKKLVISNIELLLNYAVRFYDRQFVTREVANKGVLTRFETLLNDYYNNGQAESKGLPSVASLAEMLNLSPNYLGDLIKKETSKPAHDYIQAKIIDVAKEKIFDPRKSVSEIAYELGFKYPQHFTRLFKQRVGQTPQAYRLLSEAHSS